MDIWKIGALAMGLVYLGFLLATSWLMYRDGRQISFSRSFSELFKLFKSKASTGEETFQENEKRQYDS